MPAAAVISVKIVFPGGGSAAATETGFSGAAVLDVALGDGSLAQAPTKTRVSVETAAAAERRIRFAVM